MTTVLTNDDVGKDIVDETGIHIGIVSAVDRRTAHVDPNPALTDRITRELGLEETERGIYRLPESEVVTVTDDEVRLRSV
jgi:hypothetical protein